MPISGNISSTEYEVERAGLPANQINMMPGKLAADNKVWPCGLMVLLNPSGWCPYATGDAGIIGVLDSEVDTSKTTVGMVVVFGAVRKDLIKVGVETQAAPEGVDLGNLLERHIYAV